MAFLKLHLHFSLLLFALNTCYNMKLNVDYGFCLQAEKRSLYVDMRDDDDNMDNWDEDKLKEVVEKKHGEGDKQRPTTDIVSKYISLLESSILIVS